MLVQWKISIGENVDLLGGIGQIDVIYVGVCIVDQLLVFYVGGGVCVQQVIEMQVVEVGVGIVVVQKVCDVVYFVFIVGLLYRLVYLGDYFVLVIQCVCGGYVVVVIEGDFYQQMGGVLIFLIDVQVVMGIVECRECQMVWSCCVWVMCVESV